MQYVDVPSDDIAAMARFSGEEKVAELKRMAAHISSLAGDHVVLNVNSTARGGGVAELLGCLLGFARGAGIDVRWSVIDGSPEFFAITKRIHNRLHGFAGDGRALGDRQRSIYEEVCRANADEILREVGPGDTVILHDPQTIGMAPILEDAGLHVVWRCHIGTGAANEYRAEGWDFIRPYVPEAARCVFSVLGAVPEWLDGSRATIIPPSISPFSAKNRPMAPERARSLLGHAGILGLHDGKAPAEFERSDGSLSLLNWMADIITTGPPPDPDMKMVVQVSRWDRLKDPLGVMLGFAEFVDERRSSHLVLAGPVVTGVADDPEAGAVLNECLEEWRRLPHFARSHIQLVCLPMHDIEENAALVNALQTHAAVVVQKSLEEGFGLTVTEAMWKGKPVVASAIGGIRAQIEHGRNGLLVQDPSDLGEFGATLSSVMDDDATAIRIGAEAHRTVLNRFLPDRHLLQYGNLLARLYGGDGRP